MILLQNHSNQSMCNKKPKQMGKRLLNCAEVGIKFSKPLQRYFLLNPKKNKKWRYLSHSILASLTNLQTARNSETGQQRSLRHDSPAWWWIMKKEVNHSSSFRSLESSFGVSWCFLFHSNVQSTFELDLGVRSPNDCRAGNCCCPPLPQGMMGQMQRAIFTSFGIVTIGGTLTLSLYSSGDSSAVYLLLLV